MRKIVHCNICPRGCEIMEGRRGFCGGRMNKNGVVISQNYGKITSIALDPIEKKPLRCFHPGSYILSVGSFGCNLRCSFCQNHRISMEKDPADFLKLEPDDLIEKAIELVPRGNIGIAYTYNEPLIGYEYVRDCALAASKKGMLNVVVTNGYINEDPLKELLPFIDAFNIDLKSFSKDFYRNIGGDLDVVKRSIKLAKTKSHVEVTTLIIGGENDSDDEMRELSQWLASVDSTTPFHITRFYPAYKMYDKKPTPTSTVKRLALIARESLENVFGDGY